MTPEEARAWLSKEEASIEREVRWIKLKHSMLMAALCIFQMIGLTILMAISIPFKAMDEITGNKP